MFENLITTHITPDYHVRHTLNLEGEYLSQIGELLIFDADSLVIRNLHDTKLTLPHNKYLDANIRLSRIPEVAFNSKMGHLHLSYHTDLTNLEELTHRQGVFINYDRGNDPVRICMLCGEIINLTEGQVHICVERKFDSLGEAQMHRYMSLFVCKPLSP